MPKEKHPQSNNYMQQRKEHHGHSKSAHVEGLFKVTLPQAGIAASFDLITPGPEGAPMSATTPSGPPRSRNVAPAFEAPEEQVRTLESQIEVNFTPGTESQPADIFSPSTGPMTAEHSRRLTIKTDSESQLCCGKVEAEDAEAALPLQAKPTETSSMRGGAFQSLQVIRERTSEDAAKKPFGNARQEGTQEFQRDLFDDTICGESPVGPSRLEEKMNELAQNYEVRRGQARTITGPPRRLNVGPGITFKDSQDAA